MAKIKQKYFAFLTAKTNYNNRTCALKDEIIKEMHECAKNKSMKKIESLSEMLIETLGDDYQYVIHQIKILYGLDNLQ